MGLQNLCNILAVTFGPDFAWILHFFRKAIIVQKGEVTYNLDW
jgi:hypothetical protein